MAHTTPAALPEPEQLDLAALKKACDNGTHKLVVVLGPTASGKTRFAVRLAKALNGEIISADSRQIYRGMTIGTGKDLSDYEDVPYHLIDILPAGAQYNVHQFQEDFFEAFEDIRSRGRLPILCGGTGLYINSVVSSYDFQTSKPLSEAGIVPSDLNPFIIGTLVSREERNAKIDARLDARLREGMVEEIQGLLDFGVPAQTLISYGLEYKFVTQYILGELSFDKMRELLSIAIHQFAKRQMTWFRGMERSGIRIHWVKAGTGESR